MDQSRVESLIESFIHASSGIVISMGVWAWVISPIWGFHSSPLDNLTITTIFASFGMLRGYIFRRLFNAGIHKRVSSFVKRFVTPS